jgi:hypothetical protein
VGDFLLVGWIHFILVMNVHYFLCILLIHYGLPISYIMFKLYVPPVMLLSREVLSDFSPVFCLEFFSYVV